MPIVQKAKNMTPYRCRDCLSLSVLTLLAALWLGRTPGLAQEVTAEQILAETGITGGLIVHVGCGDGRLTAELYGGASYLVHGLDSSPQSVEASRAHFQLQGLSGVVTADAWDGQHLPYIDNLVNLLVCDGRQRPTAAEIQRVLAPGGVAYTQTDGRWSKTVKATPDSIGEWTHYLQDASGNAVARDDVVGPPRHLQWVSWPTWTRHHDHMSSFNAMVSAAGRLFYILDEGTRAEIQLPPRWMLVARDAFNGKLLWKQPIDEWHPHLWPLKSGPAQLPRRLVAVGDTVYVTLGLHAPVVALDAATGKTRRVYEGTQETEEILCSDGTLFLLANPEAKANPWSTRANYASYDDLRPEPETWAWDDAPRSVIAVDAESGTTLWQSVSAVLPLSLTVGAGRVFFHDGEQIVCLDRETGVRLWNSNPVPRAEKIRSWFAPTLVVQDGVVVFSGGEKILRHRGGADTMTALSAETGAVLWTAEHPPSGYDSPEDVLIIDGLVWTAPMTNRRDSGTFTGRDLHAGEIQRTFAADDGDHMPHHRCHRAKATGRFILASRTGIEYVDLQAEHWNRHDWVRGACLYGILPANGLTYAPPHSCACYVLAKLNGLNALAPARTAVDTGDGSSDREREVQRSNRLELGPARELVVETTVQAASEGDWPTYRHDAGRSGGSRTRVSPALQLAWQTDLGDQRLSSPVIAEGTVLVAAIDRHTVHALDARTGDPRWQFTAGGRVDSPPTLWNGRVLFGCRDGFVYCLRSADGNLVWRFRAGPEDQRLVAHERLESPWPIHGSVLVLEGIVHCVAGRSMFLDGGMRYLRLDASTGRLLSETILDDRHPDTGQPLDAEIRWPNLPVALPDVLSADEESVYMRAQRFDHNGRRREVVAPSDFADQTGAGAHLFCPTGFLDDSWWHRTFWLYGRSAMSGAGGWYLAAYRAPTGRIMVCDSQRVYAFDRQPQYYPRTTALEYHLYAASKRPEIVHAGTTAPSGKTQANRPKPSRPQYDWTCQVPMLGRALVLADSTLFVAGPADVVDQEATLQSLDAPESIRALADQDAALRGNSDAVLLAVSADAGELQAAYRIPDCPVFDGMAAAGGHLVLTTLRGRVLCLGEQGVPLPAAEDVRLAGTALPPIGGERATVTPTARHPDFHRLEHVQVTGGELGYTLRSSRGKVGLALQQLESPIAGKATFRLQMRLHPLNGSTPPPGNGFFVFGDAAEDASTVKCGLRTAGQRAMIVQGPLMSGAVSGAAIQAKCNEMIEVVVTVDLEQQTVAMKLLGQTIETQLKRPLAAIRFIGYSVNTVTSEFGKIHVDRD